MSICPFVFFPWRSLPIVPPWQIGYGSNVSIKAWKADSDIVLYLQSLREYFCQAQNNFM